MSDESTSLSFLNLNWGESKANKSLIYPFILDPLFTDYYLEITYKLSNLVEKIKQINFTYKIINEDFIQVVNINNKQIVMEIGCCEFEKINFIDLYKYKLYFVLHKMKYKKQITSRNNKIYKQNIEHCTNVPIDNEYDNLKKYMFNCQINNNINFIFIENENDLFRELKNILKFLIKGNTFFPKVKTFRYGKEREYMEYILSRIPGISKCVAKNIADRFLSLQHLNLFVQKNNADALSEIIIEDVDNNKTRKLGSLQASKIIQMFISTNPNEKIQ